MSDTPRTDAETMDGAFKEQGCTITLQQWDYYKSPDGDVVMADFARQLEHELNTANATITNLRADIDELLTRLAERVQSHLAASARDVRTIQLQHIALTQIHNLTYDWADGAPDATAHDRLANEISSITRTFI